MNDPNPHLASWLAIVSSWHVPKTAKLAIYNYALRLHHKNLPVIFDLQHLAIISDTHPKALADMINRTAGFYHMFNIPKNSGGFRSIASPSPSLLSLQRWILQKILYNVEVSEHAYAYVKGRNIVDNARVHLNTTQTLKIDLLDFFPSINMKRILSIFMEIGYSRRVSFFLARICTLTHCLPQGAPTSPYLCNLVCRRLDKRLASLSSSIGLVFTRYADDITISGDHFSFSLFNAVKSIIESEGFLINPRKVILSKEPNKRIVTGISINSGKLSLPKNTKRNLRNSLHFIEKYGFESHCEKTDSYDPFYIDQLIGRFNFWLQVEPDCQFARYALKILKQQDLLLTSEVAR